MSTLDGPAGGAVRTAPRCARTAALALCALAMAAAVAACGSSSEDAVSAGPATASVPASASAPGAGTMLIVRSGGIAGVRDTVRVAADGRTRLIDRSEAIRMCRPDAQAVQQLQALDLGTVPASGSREAIADGFTYRVRSGGQQVVVAEGEQDPVRAELLAAAAAILASC